MIRPPKLVDGRVSRATANALGQLDWGTAPTSREPFPPGKSRDEIAALVAQLGGELGAAPPADDPTCPISTSNDGNVAEARRLASLDLAALNAEQASEDWFEEMATANHNYEPGAVVAPVLERPPRRATPPPPPVQDSVVDASVLGAVLIDEESVIALAPEELVEVDDPDEAIEVSVVEFVEELPPRRNLEEMDTIRPVARAAARRQRHASQGWRKGVIPSVSWSSRDETTSTSVVVG